MIVYTVHEPGIPRNPSRSARMSVVFIKEGFTWWGFLFAPAWLLFNGCGSSSSLAILLAAAVTSGLTPT